MVKDTSVIYNGKEYATLDFANPSDEDYSGCQETNNWLPLPEGWQLAPGEEDSVKVTAEFGWGTSALILANKSILVTRNGPSIDPDPNGPWAPGSQRSKQGVKTRTRDGQVQYAIQNCNQRILIYKERWVGKRKRCVESFLYMIYMIHSHEPICQLPRFLYRYLEIMILASL